MTFYFQLVRMLEKLSAAAPWPCRVAWTARTNWLENWFVAFARRGGGTGRDTAQHLAEGGEEGIVLQLGLVVDALQ